MTMEKLKVSEPEEPVLKLPVASYRESSQFYHDDEIGWLLKNHPKLSSQNTFKK